MYIYMCVCICVTTLHTIFSKTIITEWWNNDDSKRLHHEDVWIVFAVFVARVLDQSLLYKFFASDVS